MTESVHASKAVLVETSARADIVRAINIMLMVAVLVVGVVGVQTTKANRRFGGGSRDVYCASLRIMIAAYPGPAAQVHAARLIEERCS